MLVSAFRPHTNGKQSLRMWRFTRQIRTSPMAPPVGRDPSDGPFSQRTITARLRAIFSPGCVAWLAPSPGDSGRSSRDRQEAQAGWAVRPGRTNRRHSREPSNTRSPSRRARRPAAPAPAARYAAVSSAPPDPHAASRSREWSCSSRSGETPGPRGPRSGSWPTGIMCTGGRCGRPWPRRCRRRGSPGGPRCTQQTMEAADPDERRDYRFASPADNRRMINVALLPVVVPGL